MNKILTLILSSAIVLTQSLDGLLSEGQNMLNQGDLLGAKNAMEKALDLDPTFAPAMITLANVFLRQGDMEKTKEFIMKAIDADPENKEYRTEFERLNEINTLMADGQRNLQIGDLPSAYESYRIVLEKFPFFADAAYSMGLVKFREQDFQSAVSLFKTALKLNPYQENAATAIANVAKNKFNEGNNLYRSKDLEGALAAYHDVLKIDETFYLAHYQIGIILAKMGDRITALDHYRKSIEILPTFYQSWYAMSLVQKSNGDTEGAIASLQRAIEINPGYDKAYGTLGDIYIELKDFGKAIDVLKTAIQVNPQYAKGYLSLGMSYIELSKFDEAKVNLEKATALDPKDDTGWYRLATVYNTLGDCENAKKAARQSTDLKPTFGGSWLELGVAEWCGGKGNKIAAEKALEKARNDRDWRKIAEFELDKILNPQKYRK